MTAGAGRAWVPWVQDASAIWEWEALERARALARACGLEDAFACAWALELELAHRTVAARRAPHAVFQEVLDGWAQGAAPAPPPATEEGGALAELARALAAAMGLDASRGAVAAIERALADLR